MSSFKFLKEVTNRYGIFIGEGEYDNFLRGRFHLSRQTKAENETAIEMFDRAVATDHNFAAGYAELAQACVWRFFLFTPDEKR